MKKSTSENFNLATLPQTFSQQMVQEEFGSEGSQINPVMAMMPPSDRELIAQAQEKHGFEFPISLQYFYLQVNKLHIFWMLKEEDEARYEDDPWLKSQYLESDSVEDDDDFEEDEDEEDDDDDYEEETETVSDILTGQISINDLEDLFDEDASNWMFSFALAGIQDNWEGYFVLETHWELVVLIKREGDRILDNVWVADPDTGTLHDMQVTFERYLELAYLAKGFRKWQLTYLLKEEAPDYELMKRYLPQLLPGIDLDLSAFGI